MRQFVSTWVIHVVGEEKNGLRGPFEKGVLCIWLEDTTTEYSEKYFLLIYYKGNILTLL